MELPSSGMAEEHPSAVNGVDEGVTPDEHSQAVPPPHS